MYAFGIVLCEVVRKLVCGQLHSTLTSFYWQVTRKDPYEELSHLDVNTILDDVVRRNRRPDLPAKCPAEVGNRLLSMPMCICMTLARLL